ncbi:MAG TPA: zf-TFIIB domain-containing protein [Candidatus Nitrosotenuis sp.]|jgi:Zn-finger nucleic acid-binding protein|nr:zf-TFIIB domain-containing protein [Candidatus Nitrosotenuis sp.]
MALACPACRKVAMKTQVDPSGLEIDVCPECSGIWFDSQELGRFLAGTELKRRFLRIFQVEPAQTVGFVINTRARLCPRCRVALKEVTYADVLLDWCAGCQGLWFDDGELRRLLEKRDKGARGDPRVMGQLEAPGAGPGGGLVAALRAFFGKAD